MQGIFSTRRLALVIAALGALLVFAAPAMARDRNHDGISDRWEHRHDLSLKHNQAKRDQDQDGLKNMGEFRAQMDPQDADTDDDGVEDDDEGAGTVNSFNPTSGELVIDLFGGGTLSGRVTNDTEIECENDDDVEPDDHGDEGLTEHSKLARDDDNSGPSDHSGPGHDGDDEGEGEGEGENEDCDTSALVPGAVIREAEADVTAEGLVFEEIELK